jgi:hypothetical protein
VLLVSSAVVVVFVELGQVLEYFLGSLGSILSFVR